MLVPFRPDARDVAMPVVPPAQKDFWVPMAVRCVTASTYGRGWIQALLFCSGKEKHSMPLQPDQLVTSFLVS